MSFILKALYVAYGVSILTILVYSSFMLFDGNSQTRGLLSIKFSKLEHRDVSLPGALGTLAGGATSFLHIDTAIGGAASSIAAQATSAIMSAVDTTESLIAHAFPDNITVGTKYLCTGYETHYDCRSLPLNRTDEFLEISPGLNPFAIVTGILQNIPRLETFLVVGIAFAIASVVIGLLALLRWPLAMMFLLGSIFIALIFYSLSAAYVVGFRLIGSAVSDIPRVAVENGETYVGCITTLVFCSLAFAIGVTIMILRVFK